MAFQAKVTISLHLLFTFYCLYTMTESISSMFSLADSLNLSTATFSSVFYTTFSAAPSARMWLNLYSLLHLLRQYPSEVAVTVISGIANLQTFLLAPSTLFPLSLVLWWSTSSVQAHDFGGLVCRNVNLVERFLLSFISMSPLPKIMVVTC